MVHQRDEQRVEPQQCREPPVFQLLDEAANVPRIGDQHVVVAGHHHAHAIGREGIDVVQRQRCNHHLLAFAQQRLAVGRELAKAGPRLLHVRHQVTVGQHRPLGQAGGTAGVLQHGNILEAGVQRLDALPFALMQGAFEGNGLGQGIGRDHFFHLAHQRIDQPALGGGHQVAHLRFDQVLDVGIREHFLDLGPEHVQVHQCPGTGVLELMAHLPRGVQRVGVDHDQPGAQGAEYGDRVLQDVGHLHRDAIPRHQVGVGLQVTGERCAVAFQFGVGQGDTHVAECRAIRELLAGTFEHLDDRLVFSDINVQGYAGRAFVIPEIRLHCSCPLYLNLSGAAALSFRNNRTRSFTDTSSYGESGKYGPRRH
ncbi:hypothetical protein PG5_20850 [Pseudomonas sp. G5(2012)]|nr:hypothetical protein PG5_20850 [Pseudomonas sp. G5(2012)]